MGLQMLEIEKSVWHRVYKALLIHKQMEDFGGVFWQEARGCALLAVHETRKRWRQWPTLSLRVRWFVVVSNRCYAPQKLLDYTLAREMQLY